MTPRVTPAFLLSTALSAILPFAAQAEEKRADTVLDRVMVVGSPEAAETIPGSAHYIGKEELDKNNYTDINRVLRQIPGVNLQEEDGYGNRPNIGLRGGRSERSADITLMEDGVLIAPAPYASPSAYYFPRVNRMEAVEVRKGSSTVKFGPRTTSGAVNLISSSVPDEREGSFLLGYGTNNTKRAEGHYGDSAAFGDGGTLGFVLDVSHESTDGFKSIDRVGGDTGYSIEDVMGKIKYSTDPGNAIFQSFELKFGATEEDSDETYLGLTDADFNSDANRRYASTQLDHMDASHQQYQARHFVDFGSFDLTTTAYHNQFSRLWYKLDDITVGGVTSSLSDALTDATYLSALKGDTNLDGSATDKLTLRANNRDYYATGIQSDAATEFTAGNTKHHVEAGIRYHYDKEDRFQHEDTYAITDGVMSLTDRGANGSNANRHATAKATALYVTDDITVGKLTVSPGVRYEHIRLKREDFNSNTTREHSVDVIAPGIGASYELTDHVTGFGGVHKGFAPPSAGGTNDDNEESINYELGGRFNNGIVRAELVGFFNDYSNLLGECTLSSGCTGSNEGEQFNAGEVDAYGAEASFGFDAAALLDASHGLRIPVNANYTYTKAEFQNDFTSDFDEWGTVTAGDELPYIPEHQFFISAGLEADKWEFHAGGKYVGAMRTQAGTGSIPAGEGTDAHFVVDIAGEYEVHKNARVFATIDNLFDEEFVAARRPAGARSGRPFTAIAGMKFDF